MTDWEAPDPNEWNESGDTLEEQAVSALEKMEEFLRVEDPHQSQMEDMLKAMTGWVDKFANLRASELKDSFRDMLLKVQLSIAVAYLELFKSMEEPDRQTCAVMYGLIQILEQNYTGLTAVMEKEDVDALTAEMDQAMMSIAGTYPELIHDDEHHNEDGDPDHA